jgi:hypothetical protein
LGELSEIRITFDVIIIVIKKKKREEGDKKGYGDKWEFVMWFSFR